MESTRIRDTEHAAVDALIAAAGLPLDGIESWRAHQLVTRDRGGIAATAALEIHGADAVLRSVAVAADRRGEGLGDAVVRAALVHARSAGVATVYLLTETAPEFFRRFGFACGLNRLLLFLDWLMASAPRRARAREDAPSALKNQRPFLGSR